LLSPFSTNAERYIFTENNARKFSVNKHLQHRLKAMISMKTLRLAQCNQPGLIPILRDPDGCHFASLLCPRYQRAASMNDLLPLTSGWLLNRCFSNLGLIAVLLPRNPGADNFT
jgi:hypothetical protein